MKQIENISTEAYQRHFVLFAERQIELVLRFQAVAQIWTIDVTYNGVSVKGVKLALETLHVRSNNFPFDFVVIDNLNTGIDPFKQDDFSEGRCSLLMFDQDEMAEIRGTQVPL